MTMDKHQTYGRSRTPGRGERLSPRRVSAALAAARQVAIRFVADRWPALTGVAPVVSRPGQERRPSTALIARLGLDPSEVGRQSLPAAYTFTFAGQRCTADGADAPLVAAITVDDQQRIVKASLSK
jgi:hypothetical protein